MEIERVILIILDSVGVGELPDADDYGDCGCNTLGNLARARGGLNLPNLQKMGIGNIIPVQGVSPAAEPTAAFGRLAAKSIGKDTTTGHWELAGLILDEPFPLFPQGFPSEVIGEFEARTGKKTLGNVAASGTEIIKELGPKHQETGWPIVYTSADSVFQIAAHEDTIPVPELYSLCETAREILTGPYGVGRVIARPFEGQPGNYRRTTRRHDYSLKPTGPTVCSQLAEAGFEVIGVGKIYDIFAGQGITQSYPSKNNQEGIEHLVKLLRDPSWRGLLWANLVDFDMLWGHRNDIEGYAQGLEEFDASLPEILRHLGDKDVLLISADHGCDPTTDSTDHSREYVPLLIYGEKVRAGLDLGTRSTFADVGATVAEVFGIKPLAAGTSLAGPVLKKDPA